jgi:glycosyltransferase involved in cell wall biosynthesis
MRIGLEAQRLFRTKKHGMEVVALETIRTLQKIDRQNEYVVFVRDDEDNTCIQETSNFKIVKVAASSYPDWEQIRLPQTVKKERLDVLHCMSNTAPIFPPVPLVVTLHDVIFLESVEMKGTSYQNFGNLYRRFVVPRVTRKAKSIITVSHFEKNNILKYLNLPSEKIQVVYNAVADRFHNSYTSEGYKSVKQKYNLPDQFLLFSANAAPRKNTKGVIQAFAKYCEDNSNGLPLVMLNGKAEMVESILKETNQEKWLSQFLFPGYVSTDDLPLVYGLATVFLYPSFREGFGLPILEAMACGTPVITANTSSMPEVAGEAAVLVDPFRVNDIADAISHLLSDRTLQENNIKEGLARASQFSWENTAKEVLKIYNS